MRRCGLLLARLLFLPFPRSCPDNQYAEVVSRELDLNGYNQSSANRLKASRSVISLAVFSLPSTRHETSSGLVSCVRTRYLKDGIPNTCRSNCSRTYSPVELSLTCLFALHRSASPGF